MSSPDREFSDPLPVRLPQDVLQQVENFRQVQCVGGERPTMSQALRALVVLGLENFMAKQKRSKVRDREAR
jgi:hypothetical protein